MTKRGVMKFGKIEFVGKMPVLEIIITFDLDGETEEVTNYLSPFRGYAFQVSTELTGGADLGSTEVVGLKHATNIATGVGAGWSSNCSQVEIAKRQLAALATVAINHRSYYGNQVIEIPRIDYYGRGAARQIFSEMKTFSEFIDDCWKYIEEL